MPTAAVRLFLVGGFVPAITLWAQLTVSTLPGAAVEDLGTNLARTFPERNEAPRINIAFELGGVNNEADGVRAPSPGCSERSR